LATWEQYGLRRAQVTNHWKANRPGAEPVSKTVRTCKGVGVRTSAFRQTGVGVDVPYADRERQREYQRDWNKNHRRRNPKKDHASTKKWREAHPDSVATSKKRWADKNPGKVRTYHLTWHYKKYGITEADFERMWEEQGGRCAICEMPLKRGGQQSASVAIDHEHTCDGRGPVRALLCCLCNRWLGVIESAWYPKALAYLKRFKSR